MSIDVGATGRAETTVTEQNTAFAAGSGSLPVFGTPFMAALMEAAAVDALAPFLADGESTVGIRLNISHDAATPLGMAVWAVAQVTAVEGRKISFTVTAFDAAGQIGGGTHERFLIHAEKFMSKTQLRKEL